MHTIHGRLSGAAYRDDAGLATITLELAQETRFAPQMIRCLMTYGATPQAHAIAAAAIELALLGRHYAVTGECIAAVESRVWLLGVTEWTCRMGRRVIATPGLFTATGHGRLSA